MDRDCFHALGQSGLPELGKENRMSTRLSFILMLALLLPTAMYSQRLLVESDTMEGQLLQLIDQEKDQTVKLKLLEEFAKKFPNHEAITWVLSHLQSRQLET